MLEKLRIAINEKRIICEPIPRDYGSCTANEIYAQAERIIVRLDKIIYYRNVRLVRLDAISKARPDNVPVNRDF